MVAFLGVGFVAFVVYPVPLYPHHARYGRFTVFSDQAIAPAVEEVFRAVERRTAAGAVYRPDRHYFVFISHSLRRFAVPPAVADGT